MVVRAMPQISLDLLGEDVLVQIFPLTDVYTALPSLRLIDVPSDEILATFSTDELIAEVMRAVIGPDMGTGLTSCPDFAPTIHDSLRGGPLERLSHAWPTRRGPRRGPAWREVSSLSAMYGCKVRYVSRLQYDCVPDTRPSADLTSIFPEVPGFQRTALQIAGQYLNYGLIEHRGGVCLTILTVLVGAVADRVCNHPGALLPSPLRPVAYRASRSGLPANYKLAESRPFASKSGWSQAERVTSGSRLFSLSLLPHLPPPPQPLTSTKPLNIAKCLFSRWPHRWKYRTTLLHHLDSLELMHNTSIPLSSPSPPHFINPKTLWALHQENYDTWRSHGTVRTPKLWQTRHGGNGILRPRCDFGSGRDERGAAIALMTLSMLSAFGLLLCASTLPLPPTALFFVCPTRQRDEDGEELDPTDPKGTNDGGVAAGRGGALQA
ncbi:hypothetical protein B0H19DRAFT_1232808 [Mycena capillaripes]|nr:hypothetical protein B0H19DRAFT_1232808 [Mycena capillaripes]